MKPFLRLLLLAVALVLTVVIAAPVAAPQTPDLFERRPSR